MNRRAVVLVLLVAGLTSCRGRSEREYRDHGLTLAYGEGASLTEASYPGSESPIDANAGRVEVEDGDLTVTVTWQRRVAAADEDLIAEMERLFREKEASGFSLVDLEGRTRAPRHEHRSVGRYYAEIPEPTGGFSSSLDVARGSLVETCVWWCDVSKRIVIVTTTGPPDDVTVTMDGTGPQRTTWDNRRMRRAHARFLRAVDCHPE